MLGDEKVKSTWVSNQKTPEEISYFIDEAGDTTLFDRRGVLLVGIAKFTNATA